MLPAGDSARLLSGEATASNPISADIMSMRVRGLPLGRSATNTASCEGRRGDQAFCLYCLMYSSNSAMCNWSALARALNSLRNESSLKSSAQPA